MNKIWYSHSKEYSAVKKGKSYSQTWMNLKLCRQNERSQTKMSSHYRTTFILNFGNANLQSQEVDHQLLGVWSRREDIQQKGSMKFSGCRNILYFTVVMIPQVIYIQKTHQVGHPKYMQYVVHILYFNEIVPPTTKKKSTKLCLQFTPRVKPNMEKKCKVQPCPLSPLCNFIKLLDKLLNLSMPIFHL